MRLSVIAVGRVRRGYLKEGCDDYLKRLGHYLPTELVEVKDEPARGGRSPDEVRAREAQRLLKRTPSDALVFAMDERGDALTTEELAALLGDLRDRGQRDLALIIGGPLGLDPSIKAAARRQLALSSFTLPHELARLVLLEQLYRACTVLAGEPYHNP